jgi:hypothetical protein
MRLSTLIRAAAAACFSALVAVPAAAQAPNIGFVFPGGTRAGTHGAVTIHGGNLQEATDVLVSGEGVSVRPTATDNAGALPLEVSVAADAVPGMRELRVVTARGTSNAGRLWVGPYPEVNEAEPNNLRTASQALPALPVTVNGQIEGGEDVDVFTFHARAGETIVVDLVAFRIGSALDGHLTLLDDAGKQLNYSHEAFDRDPRIIHDVKRHGKYHVVVRDTLYRGGANFVYRLTVGQIPMVTGVMPMGGRRGETVQVNLEGVNLGGMTSTSVQIPAEGDQVAVALMTPVGPAGAPLALHAGDLPEVVEQEPNNSAAQATVVTQVPVVINGRIDGPKDIDLYRVKPGAGGNFVFEVHARRLGSRLDSMLRVLDASGNQLQANDDAVGKDSRLVFAVEAESEYLVEVSGVDSRYGPDVFYRLEIAPVPGPDFRLSITPDSVNIAQRGSTVVTVHVERKDGLQGAIRLRAEGLPEGVTASEALVPAGANSAQFTLTAAEGATPGTLSHLRVIGTATHDERTIERVALGAETYVPPLANPDQAVRRPTMFSLATVAPAAAYALSVEPREVTVKRGESVEIKITALRQMDQNAQIVIAVAGQPQNVNPEAAPIPEGQNEVVLKVNVAANAPLTRQSLIITGNLSNNVQTAPAVMLTIVE